MTEKKPPQPGATTREERLAAALRDNLRRRKVQSREREDVDDTAPKDAPKEA
ncbi:MAG: hypothetical protein PW843_03180 [Azospirillaceae bacterium]|nr:hypothetical protein [Azospirillaceae bacterium]